MKSLHLLKRVMYAKRYTFDSTRMRFYSVVPIYPPPGDNLHIPPEWTPEKFLTQLGKSCEQFADQFETVEEIFKSDSETMKKKDIPANPRKYIRMMCERMKRGVLTFEYLDRRTQIKKPK